MPILPLPPVAILMKCSSTNHHKCFTKTLEKQLFQANSVEELVVWLVESEKDCSLEAYVEQMQLVSHFNMVQLKEEGDKKNNNGGRSLVAKGYHHLKYYTCYLYTTLGASIWRKDWFEPV